MNKYYINIGIIDDDETKRTQIISKLEDGVEDANEEIQEQYNEFVLNPIELEIKADMNEVLEQLVDKKIDVLVVDYKLASFETSVDYTGVKFAIRTNERFLDFPIFILTSFENELYKQESFNAYQVFDYERYLNEPAERIEVNRKIIEQHLKHKQQIEEYKNELNDLLLREGESKEIDARILELDDYLEKSLDGDSAIPKEIKKRLSDDKFDIMIDLLRKLTKEVE